MTRRSSPPRGPRVVVHLGTHRTGSTALQHFLAANSSTLRNRGVHYLDAGRGGGNPENHHILALALRGKDPSVISAVIEELRSVGEGTAVISSEMLAEVDSAPALSEMFGGFRVEIVAFVRRQDIRLESAYRQRVKDPSNRLAITIWDQPGVHGHLWFYDYNLLLEPYVHRFSLPAVHLLGYDEPRDATFVYRIFLETLGADWTDDFIEPAPLERNISLDVECLEVKRLANRGPLAPDDDLALARALEVVSSEMPRRSAGALLSPEHRARIRDFYRFANLRAGHTFLGGRALFTEPLEEGTWEPYLGMGDDAREEILDRLELPEGLEQQVIPRIDARRSRREWGRVARQADRQRRRLRKRVHIHRP